MDGLLGRGKVVIVHGHKVDGRWQGSAGTGRNLGSLIENDEGAKLGPLSNEITSLRFGEEDRAQERRIPITGVPVAQTVGN